MAKDVKNEQAQAEPEKAEPLEKVVGEGARSTLRGAGKSELKSIEEWARESQTPSWAFEGLKIRQNWAAGKTVTKQEYQQALKAFLTGPLVKKG